MVNHVHQRYPPFLLFRTVHSPCATGDPAGGCGVEMPTVDPCCRESLAGISGQNLCGVSCACNRLDLLDQQEAPWVSICRLPCDRWGSIRRYTLYVLPLHRRSIRPLSRRVTVSRPCRPRGARSPIDLSVVLDICEAALLP